MGSEPGCLRACRDICPAILCGDVDESSVDEHFALQCCRSSSFRNAELERRDVIIIGLILARLRSNFCEILRHLNYDIGRSTIVNECEVGPIDT